MQPLTVLGHPLLETAGLPLPPLVLAALAVLVVLGAALLPRSTPRAAPDLSPARLGAAAVAGRVVGLLVLVIAVVVGRTGRNEVAANLAPALVVGAGWPLLVAASALLGRVWDRLDPWDTLARTTAPLAGHREEDGGGHVWWAVPAAAALVWYLAAYRQALLPRTLATALILYTVVTLAGCLAFGRQRWLHGAEIIGLLLRWIGLIPRRRLLAWTPPSGAAVVLGLVAGGLLFAPLRASTLLNPLIFGLPQVPAEWVGVAITAALGAAVGWGGHRASRRAGAPAAAAVALVPLVAAVALTSSLVRGQLILALQLLPGLLSDPLGRGWDLFGTADLRLAQRPVSATAVEGVQAGLLMLGGAVAGTLGRQRAALQAATTNQARRGATAAALMSSVIVAAGVLATTAV